MKLALLNINVGRLFRGAETLTDELGTALTRRGHEVTLLQGGPPLPGRGYRVVRIPIPWRDASGHRAGERSLAARIDRAVRVRASIAQFAIWNGLAVAAAVGSGAEVLLPMNAVHGQVRLSVLAARVARRRVLYLGGNGAADALAIDAGVDVYAVPSKAWQAWVAARSPRQQTVVIPHGVDTERFTPDGERASSLLEMVAPRFLAIAALSPVKRLELAIDGVAALGRDSLTIIGDGYLRDALIERGERALGDRFRWLPPVAYDELPSYYRAADALVFPSDSEERFGLVLLEAMAAGIPVVATDDDVRREIVGGGGLVCDPRDPAALAATLVRAISTDWRGAPRQRALELSWAESARRVEASLQ